MWSAGGPFEIRIDGVVQTHCIYRQTAIEAARYLQQRRPGATILITDLHDGGVVPFAHPTER